jgi:hypothetical protein
MEEKKKIVKLPSSVGNATQKVGEAPKPTREDVLEQKFRMIQAQWNNERNQLINEINRLAMVDTFKRLDYLFEVIKNYAIFPPEFVDKCISEVTTTMNKWKKENEEVEVDNNSNQAPKEKMEAPQTEEEAKDIKRITME